MTPGKFDWFLHTMIFLWTQYVFKKGIDKAWAALDDVEDDGGNDGGDV